MSFVNMVYCGYCRTLLNFSHNAHTLKSEFSEIVNLPMSKISTDAHMGYIVKLIEVKDTKTNIIIMMIAPSLRDIFWVMHNR